MTIYEELQGVVRVLNSDGRKDAARSLTKRVYACQTVSMARKVLREFKGRGAGECAPGPRDELLHITPVDPIEGTDWPHPITPIDEPR